MERSMAELKDTAQTLEEVFYRLSSGRTAENWSGSSR